MADTTVILRPTMFATSFPQGFTTLVGAGSTLAALQTVSPVGGTYIEDTNVAGNPGFTVICEANVAPNSLASIPAGSVITQIVPTVYLSQTGTSTGQGNSGVPWQLIAGNTTHDNLPGPAYTNGTPSGAITVPTRTDGTSYPGTQRSWFHNNSTVGEAIQYSDLAVTGAFGNQFFFLQFNDYNPASTLKRIHSAFITVSYNKPMQPVPTVNTNATLTPKITWTAPDQDTVADPLLSTQVVIFRTTDTTAAGFDPFVNTNYVWTKTISGSGLFTTVDTVSSPTTETSAPSKGKLMWGVRYTAYVRCADIIFNNALRYSSSAWAIASGNVSWTTGSPDPGPGGGGTGVGGGSPASAPAPGASITIAQPLVDPTSLTSAVKPVFDPATNGGVIGPITVRTRVNLHTVNNASFEDKAGAAAVGSWVYDTDGTGGSLTTVAGSYEQAGSFMGRIATATGGTPTRSGISGSFERTADNKFYKQVPGQILQVQVRTQPVTTRRNVVTQFGWQTAANALIGTDRKEIHIQQGTPRFTTQTMYLPVPTNASNFYQRVYALTATSEGHNFDGISVTPFGYNLLTNAGLNIAHGVTPVPDYWQFNVAAGGALTLEDTPADSAGGGFTSGNRCVNAFVTNATDTAQLLAVDGYPIDGLKYIVSAKVRYKNDFTGAPSTGSVDFGWLNDDSSVTSATTVSGLTANVWQRVGAVIDGSAVSALRAGRPYVRPSALASGMRVLIADVMLEPIWMFTNGGFESYAGTAAIEPSCCLGETTTTVVSGQTPTPQNWINESATLADVFHNGAASARTGLQSGQLTPDSGRLAKLSQYFTVAGMTSITVDWWWYLITSSGPTPTHTATLDFYDSAGVSLAGPAGSYYSLLASRTADTGFAYLHFTPTSVAIPANASYAKLSFLCQSTAAATAGQQQQFLDDVTVALTGSYGASSTYVEGGFTAGTPFDKYDATTQTIPFTVQVGLQRSSDLVNWYDVRGWSGTKGLQTIQGNGVGMGTNTNVPMLPLSNVYYDNEFPLPYPDPAGVPYVFYYRGIVRTYDQAGLNSVSAGPPSTQISVTSSFKITDWWLLDPSQLTTISGLSGTTTWGTTETTAVAALKLQVKKFHIETPESATSFILMGRSHKVVVGDAVLGDTLTLDLQTLSHTDHNALLLLLDSQKTLLLRNPDGEQWWVRAVKRTRDRTWTGTYVANPLRTYQVVFEEVDPVP